MRRSIWVIVFLVAACAPRAQLVPAPAGLSRAALDIQPVYVATTRAQAADTLYGAERNAGNLYSRLDIAVPPDRDLGAITSPRGAPDPARDFLLAGRGGFDDARAFRAGLRREILLGGEGAREAVIYVHGFNNTFAEGVLRIAQLSRDFGLPGVAVHYSWPSSGNPLGYAYDRDSVLFARDGLEALIRDVEAAGARRIVVAAHSVGSLLVMETLRSMALARPGSVARDIGGVVLISPDIDVDVFRSQARRIGTLPQPFGIFVSKRDRALRLSAQITGQRGRLGNVESIEQVSDLNVTVVDVTDFSRGMGHFTAATSPALIRIFANAGDFDAAFRGDSAGRTGLIPGTVLTVQNATGIILSPVTGLSQVLEAVP